VSYCRFPFEINVALSNFSNGIVSPQYTLWAIRILKTECSSSRKQDCCFKPVEKGHMSRRKQKTCATTPSSFPCPQRGRNLLERRVVQYRPRSAFKICLQFEIYHNAIISSPLLCGEFILQYHSSFLRILHEKLLSFESAARSFDAFVPCSYRQIEGHLSPISHEARRFSSP
jgi:hypothetical protein